MSLSNQADRSKAIIQWDDLKDRINEYGKDCQFVKPRDGLPDMVFTANAGVVLPDKRVIVSNFKCPERKGEEEWFVQHFAEAGFEVIYPSHPFEGAGDCLFWEAGKRIAVCGHGFRSDLAVYSEIGPMFGCDLLLVKLVDPRFYHLDTCFCPLDGGCLIYPKAFDEESLASIRSVGGFEIEVPEDEAKRFACNAVEIDKTVILPAGCPVTEGKLKDVGFKTVPVEMGEFIKAGGACKCLTLALD